MKTRIDLFHYIKYLYQKKYEQVHLLFIGKYTQLVGSSGHAEQRKRNDRVVTPPGPIPSQIRMIMLSSSLIIAAATAAAGTAAG